MVLIGDDLLISDDKNLMNEETKSLSAKKKRGKNQDAPSSVLPEKNGSLTITVNLVTSNAIGDQLVKSRKSVNIMIEDAGYYIDNVDLSGARNNIERPLITARYVHGLIVNHFGQNAADTLTRIANGREPNLAKALKINSNPLFLVRF